MMTVIFKTLVTFFVIYGMLEMFSKLMGFFKTSYDEKKEIFIFMSVRNKEESLEYIVRSTIFDYLENYGGRIVPYIVIVDKGSTDKTKDVCMKLSRDYEFVYYASEEEYIKFKNEIESR